MYAILFELVVALVLLAGGGIWLAARWAVSVVWALLPSALIGAACFIFYQAMLGDLNFPKWSLLVGAAMLMLGGSIIHKQERDKHLAVKRQQAHKHGLGKLKNPAAKITKAQFETPLKDKLQEISAAIFSVKLFEGHGSGFLIAKDGKSGYALTNLHVVSSEENFDIKRIGRNELAIGNRMRIASGNLDAALVGVSFTDAQPLRINTKLPEVGDDVYAIGSPVDIRFEGTLTRGVVGGIRDNVEGARYIQSDVGIAPGNSGGPLLDKWGNVIGIATGMMKHDDKPTPVNLFIPIADALRHLGIKH